MKLKKLRKNNTTLLNSRRNFIKKTASFSTAMTFGGVLPIFSAKSYSQIKGANDRINVCVMGVNSRGNALAQNFAIRGYVPLMA